MAGRPVSDRLAGLKFMQRAKARKEAEKKAEEETKVADASQWVLPPRGGSAPQCVVVVEGDPMPGALSGRMSFGSFNPTVEKLMEEAAVLQARRSAGGSGRSDSTVSDTEMAERFQNMLSKTEANGAIATKRLTSPLSTSEAQESERAAKKGRNSPPDDKSPLERSTRRGQSEPGNVNEGGTDATAVVKVKVESLKEGGGQQIEEVTRQGGWRERALERGSGPKQ